MDPPRALPDRPTAEEMVYPLNGYVVVHGQLRRIPPEDEIPDDRPEPARNRAQ